MSYTDDIYLSDSSDSNASNIKDKKIDIEKLYFLLSPVLAVILMHIVQLPYNHITLAKFGFFIAKFLVSCVFFCAVQYFLACLFSNRLVGFLITNIAFLILSVASSLMMTITGSPLVPIDFVMASQLGEISKFINLPVKPYLVCAVTFWVLNMFIYTLTFINFKKKKKFCLKRYTACLIITLLFASLNVHLICYNKYFKNTFLAKIDCKISGFDTANNYISNGFILTFFPRIGDLRVKQPEGYSMETISQLVKLGDVLENPTIKSGKDVNVIAIQSESWWDPAKLENVTMSDDPMKNIRALANGKNSFFGTMVSPSFGCNTCIPEFEFLTSLSTKLLPEGGYPYSQYVRKPISSLARIFKDNGYNTSAIHTYDKKFYNRLKAYPLMGFDELLGHIDLEEPVKKGTYISDEYFAQQIIKKYEQSPDKPLFLYGISMQNHGNYLTPRYESYDIEVNSDVLSAEDLSGLREGVQGVYDIDKSFMMLVDYFKHKKDPTLIIMYGDHLPFLGINSSTFRSVGFMQGNSIEQNANMYETPYIIWANYDISDYDIKQRVGPQYLGISAVKMAKLKNLPWHFKFFDEFYTKYTVYQHSYVCNENGEYVDEDYVLQEDIKSYQIIQYDCLFGKETYAN